MSCPKDGVTNQDVSEDDHPKTEPFNRRHRRKDREVKTSLVEQGTGVKTTEVLHD